MGNDLVRRWVLLFAIVAAVVVADQGTKLWAVANLTHVFERAGAETAAEKVGAFYGKRKLERMRTQPVVVHDDWFQLRYVENPGAAWGMLGGLHDKVRIPFFYVVSVFAIGIITWIFSRIRREQRLLQVIFATILGGAIGNFVDRITRGYVIDFIDWHWKHQGRWPTFNVADVAISVGLAGLVLEALLGRRRQSLASIVTGQAETAPDPEGGQAVADAIAGPEGEQGAAGQVASSPDPEAGQSEPEPIDPAPHSALSLGALAREHADAAGPHEPASFPSAAADPAPGEAGAATCTPISSPGSSRLPS